MYCSWFARSPCRFTTKDHCKKKIRREENQGLTLRQRAPLTTPSDLSGGDHGHRDSHDRDLVAVFALYLKTKNLHWHMSGPRFRDYHLLLDGQVAQFFAMIDPIAERMRKVGGTMLKRQVNEKRRGERQRRMMFARQEINAGLRVMGALNVSAGPSCL
jgi:hypothetical protein